MELYFYSPYIASTFNCLILPVNSFSTQAIYKEVPKLHLNYSKWLDHICHMHVQYWGLLTL